MIINRKQYAMLQQLALSNFMKRAIAHLRQEMPDHTKEFSDEQLHERIELTIKLANRYGLDAEQDVICLLDAGLLLNDSNFSENPQYPMIQSVLRDEDMAPEERARQALVLAFQQTLIS